MQLLLIIIFYCSIIDISSLVIMKSNIMRALKVKVTGKVNPTGDPNFTVAQAFPFAFKAEEVDPFLMCDHFGPAISKGVAAHPDQFDVNWHPHRGMDILTYLLEGVGRHADSLGNRGTYATPGMQWISVGSGIEHAEGGGTPEGQVTQGFQIWINTPSKFKMEDPEYGIEPPENIPVWEPEQYPGVKARVLAGEVDGLKGPFKTKQSVQITDLMLDADKDCEHSIPSVLDTTVIYVYNGSGDISGESVKKGHVLLMDAKNPNTRSVSFKASKEGLSVMIFAGKRINEPIAWHGPFVMNTQDEIQRTIREYQTGRFFRKRADWDYKRIATKPKVNIDDDKSSCL